MGLITAILTSSLDSNVEKYNLVNESNYKNQHLIESIVSDPKDGFLLYENTSSLEDKIKKEIESISKYQNNWDGFGAPQISAEVFNNSLNIIDSISPNSLNNLNPENIYPSKYGTIILDWIFENDNIFSIEIGKNSVGYFYEKGNTDSKQVENLSIDEVNFYNTIPKINSDLSVFI